MNIPETITAQMLRERHACRDQVGLFEATWPNGARLTLANLRKAARLGFDLDWWAGNFLPATALAEYKKAAAPALAAYHKATAPARAEYEKATAPAWAEYQKARAPALAAYHKATAPAWAEYQKARAPAWAEYQKATAPALWSAIQGARDALKPTK